MAYSSRHYSNKQEKAVAKSINGKKVPNSGATMFNSGDVKTDKFVIECKTSMTEKRSFSIKKDWIIKAKEECFSQGRPYWALAFNFGGDVQNKNYYIIDESLFNELKNYIESF